MKARILAMTAFLAAAMISNGVAAPSASKIESFKTMLRGVPKLEMPGKAATEVRNAKANDKKDTALALVYAAASISPASVPSVVRSISRVAPEYGTELVSLGTQLVPPAFTPEVVKNPQITVAASEITPAGTASGNLNSPWPGVTVTPNFRNIYPIIDTRAKQFAKPPRNYTN